MARTDEEATPLIAQAAHAREAHLLHSAYRPRKHTAYLRALFRVLLAMLGAAIFLVVAMALARRSWARTKLGNVLQMLDHGQYLECSDPRAAELCRSVSARVKQQTYMLVVDRQNASAYDFHPAESVLLATLFVKLTHRDVATMREILSGAHVLVHYPPDRSDVFGWYYLFISHLQRAAKRASSHRSVAPQYGVPEGKLLRTVLVGEADKTTHDTWFQFEANPWDPWHLPLDSFMHMFNYLQYLFTGYQIGPLGSSNHTDSNPLAIEYS